MSPQSESVQGTPATHEAVVLIADSYKAVKQSFEDGKLDLTDLRHFMPVVEDLPKFVSVVGQIPAELKNLDSQSGAALLADIISQGGLEAESAAKVRGWVETVLLLTQGVIKGYQTFQLA